MTLVLFSAVLVATVLAGLWRIVVGPTHADRMLAVQLFGTAGAAVLLVWAQISEAPALRDAALVLALLAAVVSAALVQFLRRQNQHSAQHGNTHESTALPETDPRNDTGADQ